ncbi:MAG: sensor histidine kinase [Flavisolibacter sp.]
MSSNLNTGLLNTSDCVFLDAHPLPTWIVDAASFEIRFANKAVSNLYNYWLNDAKGNSFLNFFPEKDRLAFVDAISENSQNFSGSYQHNKKGGETIAVELYASSMEVNAAECYQISAVVSNKKKIEEENYRYKTFIEQSIAGIFCKELKKPVSIDCQPEELVTHLNNYGYISECNASMAAMCGFEKKSDMDNCSLNQLLKSNDAETLAFIKNFAGNNFKLVNAELREKNQNGETIYYLTNVIGIVENGFLTRIWGSQRDITARRKIEENNRLLAQMVEETSDILVAADIDYKPLSWNKAAEKIFGLTAGEVIGKDLRDFVTLEYKNYSREQVRHIIQKEGEWYGEACFTRRSDNKQVTLLGNFKLLKDGNRPLCILINGTDITQRIETERELCESEARKSAVMESSLDAIITIEAAGAIIEWNAAAERIFGYTKQEALHRQMEELIIPERYRQRHLDGISQLLKTDKGPMLNKLTEVPVLHKDGTEFPSELYISRINISGKTLFTATLRNVAERKKAEKNLVESEKRFREVADSAPVMIWMLNEKNETIYVNKPWTDFTGSGVNMLGGEGWSGVVHPDDRAHAITAFNKNFESKEPITTIYRLKNKNGQYRWMLDTAIPRQLNDGSFLGYIGSVVDITDQKIKEDQLRYQAMVLENISDIVLSAEVNGIVKSWNKAAEKFYGITAQQANGTNVADLVQLEYLDMPRGKALQQLFETGFWRGEVSYRNQKGELKYLLNTLSLVVDEGKKEIAILEVGRDITDRKIAEQKLQQSEGFYRTLISDSLDGIILMNAEGRITFCSPSVKHVLGYEAGEVEGKDGFEFVHPDDFAWAIQSFQKEVIENPEVKFITIRLRKKGDQWIWCTVRGNNLLRNPNVASIVIYFHDDTLRKRAVDALKESEKRFRTLIKDLQTGVLLQDAEGYIQMSNNAALKVFDEKEETLLHKQIWKIYSDIIQENGKAFEPTEGPIRKAIHTRQLVKDVVIGIWHQHKKDRIWLLLTADPILDEAGNLLHVICSFTDITERKRLEQKLLSDQINHQKQLTQATIDGQEAERHEIGKELHDNFGQQLTTIKLFLDMAKSGASDSGIEMINMALKGVMDVINEIRSMSRSLVPHTLKDLGLVDSIAELVDSFSRTQLVSIDFEHEDFDEDDLPENQKLTLFRIVQEQLNNIIKHADAEGIALQLKNTIQSVVLEIRDDGKGFDLQKLRKGLGFTNIRNRAELFGGKMEIFSRPGKGCRLKVSMPVHVLQSFQ